MAVLEKTRVTSIGKDVEKANLGALLVGLPTGAAAIENGMEVPQKGLTRVTI